MSKTPLNSVDKLPSLSDWRQKMHILQGLGIFVKQHFLSLKIACYQNGSVSVSQGLQKCTHQQRAELIVTPVYRTQKAKGRPAVSRLCTKIDAAPPERSVIIHLLLLLKYSFLLCKVRYSGYS